MFQHAAFCDFWKVSRAIRMLVSAALAMVRIEGRMETEFAVLLDNFFLAYLQHVEKERED